MTVHIVFSHGWGFDGTFFKDLSTHFCKLNCTILDHGYFAPIKFNPKQISPHEKYVGIGHSLGFIKLLQSRIQFDSLIAIQSFTNFLGYSSPLSKIRKKQLDHLEKSFQADHFTTLHQFHQTCGLTKITHNPFDINTQGLKDDLALLRKDYLDIISDQKILFLSSHNDPVVTSALTSDHIKVLKKEQNSRKMFIHLNNTEFNNHLMGYAGPSKMATIIKKFIRGCG